MFVYSATQWIFGNEPMETSLRRLSRFGYDGVELAGEPAALNVAELRGQLARHGLVCTSICGIYTAERDLSHPDEERRRQAVHYVKACIDLAVEVGASVIIVVPSPVGRLQWLSSREEEWAHAVSSLKEAGAYAGEAGVRLAIEALNRFETVLVNTLDAARQLAEAVNEPSVGVMADLFHMNIEERDHVQALRSIAPYLMHVHIADNTREAAGLGQTDFAKVFRTLLDIGYVGSITMEFLPRVSNPYEAAGMSGTDSLYDAYTKQSIDHIRGIVAAAAT